MLRGKTVSARNAAKTRCPHGHPYSMMPSGRRYCKTCTREERRKAYEADPEKFKAAKRAAYERNPEKFREKSRRERASAREEA
jgi:hypothetical protein